MHGSVPMDNPRVLVFGIAALACLALTQLPLVIKRDMGFQRRCYWGGTAGAMLCVVLAALPDWVGGVVFALVTLFGMTLAAYFTSSYLKIGGKVYAFHAADEKTDATGARKPSPAELEPDYDPLPDQYGTDVSATKMWWLMVPATALISFTMATNFGHGGKVGLAVGAAFAMVVVGAGYGVLDASWGYRIARKQYLQFVIIGLITGGTFTVFYFLGFGIGRAVPMRPKRSLERAVHPRFRDEPPPGQA